MIDYCRRFGVALQPYIFASRANLVHSGYVGNGKTVQVRRAVHDLQGHVAELLAKCIDTSRLDLSITADDLAKLRDMLAIFGDLDRDERNGKVTYTYTNRSGRAGYETPPGLVEQQAKPLSPLALDELLRSRVWNDYIFREADYSWQTSLLEPVGGMDHFVKAFANQPLARTSGTVASLIRYGAKVTGVELADDEVSVRYSDQGSERTLTARLLRLHHPDADLRELPSNLPAPYRYAADKLPVQAAGKVGWQAERFWETQGPDLRRHLLDHRRYRADLVSVVRLPRSQGRADRRLHVWGCG